MNNIVLGIILLAILGGGGLFLLSPQGAAVQHAAQETVNSLKGEDVSQDTSSDDTHSVDATFSENHVSNAHEGMATHGGVDEHAIPLGDGNVSTSPRVGYVYSCQTTFTGGGAEHAGDWIQGNFWDLTKKVSVEGDVSWPEAMFSAMVKGASRVLSGNGLPVGSDTGVFPISRSDPAYQYDRNPNSVEVQNISFSLPANPTFAASPSCVPMGAIGYALNGVAIYNALDDAGRDAVAHETQDTCSGHPQQQGQYHYHGPSECMPHADENNTLVGYALDGFGIFSRFDAEGNEYSNADLDECHGITSPIEWNRETVNMYHYVLTEEYPYTVGCFRGTPVNGHVGAAQNGSQGAASQSGPPQAAIDACSGKSNGAACSIGAGSGTCRTTPEGAFACVPQ